MNKTFSRLSAFVTMVMLFVSAIYYVAAVEVPMGAQTVTEGFESTINQSNYAPAHVDAYAGNISELTLYGRTQTKHWQGYYGEITGTIVLDDAQNWTLYDWPDNEPQGEIYATINVTTPDWQSIECFNYSATYTGTVNHTKYWEDFYNMTFDDVDGIDETFNMTSSSSPAASHPQFDVGEFTIQAGSCPSTYTHVTDNWQAEDFSEVLLQDQFATLVFTTIIENKDVGTNADVTGYNDVTHDFQMLVAEDGTSRVAGSRNQDITTYYFYIDLQ